ncbi:Natural killer cell receptor 2B4 [Aix galericulata]|nr:Natural killer cell receptor 2B4 [Aix galericulata]
MLLYSCAATFRTKQDFSFCLITDLLLLLHVSCLAAETTELWAEEGSSVTMHAPAIRNISLAEWEYIRDDIPELILQYYAESQSVTIYTAYKGRVVFYQNNGSLVLQKLRETDSGTYKATVNLMQDKATTTTLRVIKPLPQPKLLSSSNLAGSLINLTCVLPEGTVADVSWKKDGHPLPPEKFSQITGKTTVLQIRKAEKSDCSSYSCIINNSISWKVAALNLTVTGPSAAFILLGLFLSAGIVAMALTAVAMAPCRPAVLTRFRSKGWHRVILCITATTLVVNLLFTSLLLRSFHQLHAYKKNQESQQQPDPQEVTHSLQTTSTSESEQQTNAWHHAMPRAEQPCLKSWQGGGKVASNTKLSELMDSQDNGGCSLISARSRVRRLPLAPEVPLCNRSDALGLTKGEGANNSNAAELLGALRLLHPTAPGLAVCAVPGVLVPRAEPSRVSGPE